MANRLTVVISSTARDLPAHRDKVMHACQRVGVFPTMMEHLPASPDGAIAASIKLVDEADIYVGVFAHRYGYVPDGHATSITEMEYERAVERKIPRLIFLMGDDHLVTGKDFDTGDGAAKLGALKERLTKEQVVNFFTSPDALLAYSIDSLNKAVDELRVDAAGGDNGPASNPLVASLVPVSDIPTPPEPFVAHPYTLLETRRLVGRQEVLDFLTDWTARPEKLRHARVLSVVAVSGMGKSALTWKWFNDIAPQEMSPLTGRVWWSFYEAGAAFENFVTRTLAYVTGQSAEEVAQVSPPEREQRLLAILDQQPYLVVLDGLERVLVAYARMDAAFLQDDDLDDEAANYVAGAHGLPESAGQSFVGRHRLRKTADPHVGQFLRRLASVRASRILISSRLYPAELQAPLGGPLPGCSALFLPGLNDRDALDLWRAYGAQGSREVMLPVFTSFGSHPLLIQLLAYEVARFHDAPGDFDAWRAAHPDFDPFNLPLVQVQTQVLEVALRGLSAADARTLHVISGFRTPAGMETLKALLIRRAADDDPTKVPYANLTELDAGLTELEDRGLLGWDRRSNRYDLHPIVRGVTWHGLDEAERNDVYSTLEAHFEAMPTIDYQRIESLEDLRPAIELYYTLIGRERYEEAFELFRARLDDATLYRLSASRQQVEMLERLFPDGTDALPRLKSERDQSFALNALALGHQFSGAPGVAVPLFRRAKEIDERAEDHGDLAVGLSNLSDAQRLSGDLHGAEASARSALVIDRERGDLDEVMDLYMIGRALSARGTEDAEVVLERSLRLFIHQDAHQLGGVVNSSLAEHALWMNTLPKAESNADRAWERASVQRHERDFVRAARMQGMAALEAGDLTTARERLEYTLTRARAVNLAQEELPTLVALAELHRREGQPAQAREHLEDVWESAERGPYPLFHADALNVLAQIERDQEEHRRRH